jgi:hypothetical protein
VSSRESIRRADRSSRSGRPGEMGIETASRVQAFESSTD